MGDQSVWDFVVLGGGLAGLTFALEAARRGRPVAVLEAGTQPGGLSRTLTFGDYRFDLGGHRFHSAWPEITEWVKNLMDGELLHVARRSRIRLNGSYVDYPIQFPNALTALETPQAAQVLWSYLAATCARRPPGSDRSFEDWVVRRFGRALYEIYFRPYTEKVWGMSCTELSADWASQRIQLPSLAVAVRESLRRRVNGPATLVSRFLYPPLGIGMLADRLVTKLHATGRGMLSLNSRVVRLEERPSGGWKVHYHRAGEVQALEGRQVISTVPLPQLLTMVPLPDPRAVALGARLAYRSLICVFLAVDGPRISEDTWTYFPDRHLVLGRTHEPINWSPQMAPAGQTSLCVEIFCSVADATWQQADGALIEATVADLDRLSFLPRARVREAWLVRVPDAYPIYRTGYAEVLHQVRRELGHWPTLHLAGRTGTFHYLNMDGVFKQAIELAGRLCPLP